DGGGRGAQSRGRGTLSVQPSHRPGQCADHAGVPFGIDLDQAAAGARRRDRDRPAAGRPRPPGADRAARRERQPARQHGRARRIQRQRLMPNMSAVAVPSRLLPTAMAAAAIWINASTPLPAQTSGPTQTANHPTLTEETTFLTIDGPGGGYRLEALI